MNEEEEYIKNKPLINLAFKQLNLHYHSTYEFEEYNDAGLDGLLQGIRTYDESKGVKKSTYYYACIRNEINKLIYQKQMQKRKAIVISINTPLNEDGDELLDILPSKVNIEKEIEESIRNEKLLDLVNELAPKDREIIKYSFGLDGYEKMSTRQIGMLFKNHHNAIAQRRTKALRQLWYKIKNNGL